MTSLITNEFICYDETYRFLFNFKIIFNYLNKMFFNFFYYLFSNKFADKKCIIIFFFYKNKGWTFHLVQGLFIYSFIHVYFYY